MILDWNMPDINGAEFMRIVRSPLTFPLPAVPIIMLTGQVERETVVEAVRLGVNEFLCKPVSAKTIVSSASLRSAPSRARWCGSATITARRRAGSRPMPKTSADPTEPVWLA